MSMNCCMRDSLRYLSVNGTHKTSIKAPSKPVQYSPVGGGGTPYSGLYGEAPQESF